MTLWVRGTIKKTLGRREWKREFLPPLKPQGKESAKGRTKEKPWTPGKDADPRMKEGPNGEAPLMWRTVPDVLEEDHHAHGNVEHRDYYDTPSAPKRDW